MAAKMLKRLFDTKGITPDDITYYMPHMSSNFFKDKIYQEHVKTTLKFLMKSGL